MSQGLTHCEAKKEKQEKTKTIVTFDPFGKGKYAKSMGKFQKR